MSIHRIYRFWFGSGLAALVCPASFRRGRVERCGSPAWTRSTCSISATDCEPSHAMASTGQSDHATGISAATSLNDLIPRHSGVNTSAARAATIVILGGGGNDTAVAFGQMVLVECNDILDDSCESTA